MRLPFLLLLFSPLLLSAQTSFTEEPLTAVLPPYLKVIFENDYSILDNFDKKLSPKDFKCEFPVLNTKPKRSKFLRHGRKKLKILSTSHNKTGDTLMIVTDSKFSTSDSLIYYFIYQNHQLQRVNVLPLENEDGQHVPMEGDEMFSSYELEYDAKGRVIANSFFHNNILYLKYKRVYEEKGFPIEMVKTCEICNSYAPFNGDTLYHVRFEYANNYNNINIYVRFFNSQTIMNIVLRYNKRGQAIEKRVL